MSPIDYNLEMHLSRLLSLLTSTLALLCLSACGVLSPFSSESDAPISAREQDKVCKQLADADYPSDALQATQAGNQSAGSSMALLDSEASPSADPMFHSVLKDWEHLTFFPFKTPTRYTLQQCDPASGDRFLSVDAQSSASSMVRMVNMATNDQSRVRWKWWVSKSNQKAKTRERTLEDSPIRVVLSFDGDKSKLSEDEQGFLSRMEVITRRPAPYATLMYSIGSGVEKYEIITPQYTKTIRIKAVQTTHEKTGQWRVFDRNIENDFLKAFGEKPGRLMSIAIMGDADNTKSSSRAFIADLELRGLNN